MPSIESTLLPSVGPQQGYGQPFGGPYSNVYGTAPGSQTAQDQYWQTLNRGYANQGQQLVRDAFTEGLSPHLRGYDWRQGIQFDPTTGRYTFDASRIQNPRGVPISADDIANMQRQFEVDLQDSNEDKAQARQQLEGLAQQQLAQRARTEQMATENAGFQRELARYQSPDLMNQMVNPQMQQAANQAMATANAAGMAGGSMGQAANRRAAMQGMGQQFSQVVPQAAVAQAGQDFQWQKAREGMINNYYGMQQERAQRDLANEMTRTGFLKGMEEYEHSRDREDLVAAGSFMGQGGAFLGTAAPFLKGSPNAGGK